MKAMRHYERLRLHIRLGSPRGRSRLLYPSPRLLFDDGDAPPPIHALHATRLSIGITASMRGAGQECRRGHGDDGREERQAEEGGDERPALAVVEAECARDRRGHSMRVLVESKVLALRDVCGCMGGMALGNGSIVSLLMR